jgi:hypothetical protein
MDAIDVKVNDDDDDDADADDVSRGEDSLLSDQPPPPVKLEKK